MGWKLVFCSAVCFAASACVTAKNADAPPGGMVTVENQAASWMPKGISGEKIGIENWVRVRVITPADARECTSGSLLPLVRGGPQSKAKPGDNREVMLTTDPNSGSVHVRCSTQAGEVSRTVKAYRYSKTFFDGRLTSSFFIQPPLVHMDPADPDAEERWARLREEICKEGEIGPRSGFLCEPEIFAALRNADIGRPS